MNKALNLTRTTDAQQKLPDVEVVGDGDAFKLICKVSSQSQGWIRSTRAMQVPGGCLVQVSTQQFRDDRYSVAEALAFVPGASIRPNHDDEGTYRIG